MLNKAFILLGLSLALITSSKNVFASESQEVGTVSPESSLTEKTSQDRRKSLSFIGTLQPAGFGPIPEFSQGVTLGYFLKPNSILQLEYMNARTPFKTPNYSNANGYGSSTSSRRWYSNLNGYSIGIHLKQFFGNSFYLKSGLDYKNLTRENSYEGTEADSFTVEFSGESVAAALAFGNQWQYSHFTIGCDWIGISAPLSHSVRNESSRGPVTEAGYNTRQNGEARYLSMTSLQLLRIYAGASF
jgi:hypothetical protein